MKNHENQGLLLHPKMPQNMLSVTYFYRQPRKTGLSIEGIFRQVRDCLKGRVNITEFYCAEGASRIQSIRQAGKAAGGINHITGDVNFLAMGMGGKKNILTIHDFGYYETLKRTSFLRFLFYRLFWFSIPLKYVTIVTVVSEFTKSKLIAYLRFPESRIRVIPDPVKSVFQFDYKERSSLTPRILMLGTGKHKNLDCLIEASRGTNWHLDIVGWPSPDETDLLKQYGIAHTIYNGLTDEQVYDRYKACDLLYFASHHEGFGMPIIEAQAVGRPVITSNLGAMKEVAKDTAILVDPKDPSQVKNAVMSLANDLALYQNYVQLGLKNAALYDHKIIAEQYLQVYKELAGTT